MIQPCCTNTIVCCRWTHVRHRKAENHDGTSTNHVQAGRDHDAASRADGDLSEGIDGGCDSADDGIRQHRLEDQE